ncbi:MAG: hypothetical protein IKP23_03060 [Elusimicrobiaceae bacterium]|nr:hypothetical protein [Elusimicrobiaceae bacterium]
MNKYLFLIFLFCPLLVNGGGQSDLKLGDKAYSQKKYGTAYEHYQKAAAQGKEEGFYNSGAALYRLEDFGGASEQYLKAAQDYEKSNIKSAQNSYYNLANSQYKNNQTKEALSSAKKAILLNGKDEAAIHNMQFMLEQCQNGNQGQENKEGNNNAPKDNQENSQDQNQQGSNSPDNQNQDNQDNQDKNGQGQDNQDQNNQDQDSQNQNSQGQNQDDSKLSQQEAQDILNMLGNGEQKGAPPPLQGQTGNNRSSQMQVEKDW